MMITEFVTAEDSQSPRRGVWVMLRTLSVKIDDVVLPARFEITTSTGYLATLSACRSDSCVDKINCTWVIGANHQHSGQSVNAWCEHIKTHCHAYHLPRAEQFRDTVMKTYAQDTRRRTERLRDVMAKTYA